MPMRLRCRNERFPRAAGLPCAQARSALSLGSAAKPQGRGQPLLGGRKSLLLANRAAEGVENIPCAAGGHASGAALHGPCRVVGSRQQHLTADRHVSVCRVVDVTDWAHCCAGSGLRHTGADAKRPLDTSPLLPHKRRQLVRSKVHALNCWPVRTLTLPHASVQHCSATWRREHATAAMH
jgi:hypothetical protein